MIGNRAISDEETLRAIKPNETSKEEVRSLLGKPRGVTTKAGGIEAWTYTVTRSIGRLSGGEAEKKVVTVTFGPDGIVQDVSREVTVSSVSAFGGVQTKSTGD